MNERLAAIRRFYARHADTEGKLPLADYLAATIEARDDLASGRETPEAVAARRGLNGRYLATLWASLNDRSPSPLLAGLRDRWRKATPADAPAMRADRPALSGNRSARPKTIGSAETVSESAFGPKYTAGPTRAKNAAPHAANNDAAPSLRAST